MKNPAAGGATSAIDTINRRTMASAQAVAIYAELGDQLTPPERAILGQLKEEVRGGAILDLGVGAGRTVAPLLELSHNYVGIDYAAAMVTACRQRYPEVDFRCADARDLSMFAADSFKLLVFSCNGLCMVGHADRQLILREACRVLAHDGAFVFSTYNKRSSGYTDGMVLPKLVPAANPARTVWRALQVVRATVSSVYNRCRYARFEQHTEPYAVINDRCHDYATMLYYVDIQEQRRQLAQAGFLPTAQAFDMQGRPVRDDVTDCSVAFVARKAAS